jgi:beta-phosphoglucomutase-like phosphatase (HAD superfamily)
VTTATASSTAHVSSRVLAPPPLRAVPPGKLVEASAVHEPIDLEALSARWQRALDAAGGALSAAGDALPASELRDRRIALTREIEQTATALRELVRGGRQPAPWLSSTPVTNRMLGLAATVRGCVFDVEGVLTDSSALHAWAWAEVFDGYLAGLGESTGWHLIPFDRVSDYREHVAGRSRLESVRAFLRSRGIRIQEGFPGDPSDAATAHGLARRKGELVASRLQERGVTALLGARRYLEATRRAGVRCAVVYESASTLPVLEQAGLASLVDVRVDGEVITAERLRSRPDPDLLLAACRRLDVAPHNVVAFTGSPAGIVAGRQAGMSTVGVGGGTLLETLAGVGADQVVPSLSALLDPRLHAATGGEE